LSRAKGIPLGPSTSIPEEESGDFRFCRGYIIGLVQ